MNQESPMYMVVTDIREVREYLNRQSVVAFDIETAPVIPYRYQERAALDPHKAQIVGISFSVAEGSGIYVPLAHRRADNADASEIWALLAEFAADPKVIKVAHNLAFESMFFYAQGIVIQPPVYDTIAAAQLTLKSNTTFRTLSDSGLKTLIPKLIGDTLPTYEQVTGGRHFDHLANAEEDAFLNGNGTTQPLGLLAATGGGQIGVTTASATAITSDEVINLVYALKRTYRKNAAFIANDQTLATLRKLKDSSGQYIWQPSYQAGEPDRLLGYSIYTSAYFPVIEADKPALAFGDYRYYNIGDRGTRSFAELKELFAGNGMIGYLAKERVDGKLVLPEAVQIMKMKASA